MFICFICISIEAHIITEVSQSKNKNIKFIAIVLYTFEKKEI